MKMTQIEKRFVNRKKKAEGNIKKIQSDFLQIEIGKINTVLELGCGIGFVSTYLTDSHNFNVFCGFKEISHGRLAHGPLSQHHFVLQLI